MSAFPTSTPAAATIPPTGPTAGGPATGPPQRPSAPPSEAVSSGSDQTMAEVDTADMKAKRSLTPEVNRQGSPSPPPSITPSPTRETDEKQLDNEENGASAGDAEAQKTTDIYDRFPPRKKKLIVAIVAYSAFLGRECCRQTGYDEVFRLSGMSESSPISPPPLPLIA